MNRTIRTLIAAAPIAVAAVSMTAAPALAETPVHPGFNPGLEIAQPTVDPESEIPGDLTNPETGPVVNPDIPPGPGDLTNPQPCPTHGVCGSSDDDDPEEVDSSDEDFDLPKRIDTGAPSDGGLDLAWLLAGGAVVTAAGTAFAARRVAGVRT